MQRKRLTERPTAIDLFSGCGGLTVGLRRAGFAVLAAVDNDPASVHVYKDNHPDVRVFEEDIRHLRMCTLKRKLGLRKGDLDLLAGCPPCQGFSRMTTLNGRWHVDDPRNRLINEFLRFVNDLLPKTVMMENVPGLASNRRFSLFCSKLRKLGYTVNWDVVNAADHGVPQRRRRLMLLASLNGRIDFPPPDAVRRTVREAIAKLPKAGTSGDEIHDLPEQRNRRVGRLISLIPENGGSRTDLEDAEQLQCHRKCDGFNDVYGRMAWDAPSPTITTGCFNPSKGRFLHPKEDRCITLREAALLQSFPVEYKFRATLGKCTLALLIGNALPPELVNRHAAAIRLHLEAIAGNKRVKQRARRK